jgi:hypothetical protein
VITARTVLDWLRGCDLPELWLSAKTSTDRRMVQHDSHAQTAARGWAFPVSGEVTMATDIKPLRDQIADASVRTQAGAQGRIGRMDLERPPRLWTR